MQIENDKDMEGFENESLKIITLVNLLSCRSEGIEFSAHIGQQSLE